MNGRAWASILAAGLTLPFLVVPAAHASVPPAPTSVRAEPWSTTSLRVDWTGVPETGILGYTATAFDAESGGATAGSCTISSFNWCYIESLRTNTRYWVSVTARNASGTGPASSPRVATSTTAIPPPAGVTVGSPTASTLTASWTAASGATAYIATAYSAETGGTVVSSCTTSSTSCAIGSLNGNTQYWVAVQVSAPAGANSDSSRVAGTTSAGVPTAPTSVSTTVADTSITARWSAPSSNGGSAITGYRAQAWSAASGGSVIDFCETTGTSCQIKPLTNGTTYYVAVYATNTAGDGASSDRIAATPGGSPSAPRSVTATRGDGSVSVEWQAPATDATSVTSYTAQIRASATSSAAVIGSCTGTGLGCTITGLDNGTTYYVSVFATASSGDGPASSFVSVSRLGAPSAPREVAATAGNGFAAVSWRAPADTGGSAIQRYVVRAYRDAEGGDPITTCEPNPLSSLRCNLGPLPNGSAYFVDVTATNSRFVSPASSPRVRVFTAAAPDAPRTVTAVLEGSGVRVRWQTPPSDGGYAITRYTATAYATPTATQTLGTCTATGDTCLITGLDGYAYISVVATTTAGSSAASSPRAQVFVPGAPGAPRAVAASPSGRVLTVSWLRPADDQGVPVQIFEAVAKDRVTSQSARCTIFEPQVPRGVDPWSYRFTCDITGLKPSATYDVTVTSANTFSTVASTPIGVPMPGGPPSEPRGFVVHPGDDHVTAEAFLPATDGGAVEVTLRFRAWTKEKAGKVASTCSVVLGNRDSIGTCELADLANYEPYWIDAVAINEAGRSRVLARVMVEPLPSPPGAPRDFRVTQQPGALLASWIPPSADGGFAIRRYIVRATDKKVDGRVLQTCISKAPETSCTLTGLTSGQLVWITVVAENTVGEGAPSTQLDRTSL